MGFWDKVKDAMAGDDAVRREQPAAAPLPESVPEAVAEPVAVTEEPANAEAAEPGPGRSCTVVIGETLAEIAAREGSTPDAIAAASGLAHQDRIYPGLVLTIPSGPATSVPQS